MHFLLLVHPPLSLFSQLLLLVGLADVLLATFELVCVLADVLLLVSVHVLKAAVRLTLLLILFEDLVHYVLTIFLVLPAVCAGVAPVLA